MNTVMSDRPQPHRISADEYMRMGELCLIPPCARVELIEGEIVDMAPIGCIHQSVVDRLTRLLMLAVGSHAIVRAQGPVRLSSYTESQPDLALLKARADFWAQRHPFGPETLLVIEVSESSLRYELGRKASLYGRYGVPEVWVVDVNQGRLHVFGKLADEVYTRREEVPVPGAQPIETLPEVSIDLSFLATTCAQAHDGFAADF